MCRSCIGERTESSFAAFQAMAEYADVSDFHSVPVTACQAV